VRSPEQVRLGADRLPAEAKDVAGIVAVAVHDVFPAVGRFALEHDVEAVVLVPARVVLFETRQLPDHSNVLEACLLEELAPQPVLEPFVRLEPPGGNLHAHLGLLGIVEDEQFRRLVADARDVGDDAAAARRLGQEALARSAAL
jgi:hypothetical protein